MKLEILRYAWLPTGTYHKNMVIWKKKKKKKKKKNLLNLVNLGHLFHEKFIDRSKPYFSGENLAPIKNHCSRA
jgi:hypothetical protein